MSDPKVLLKELYLNIEKYKHFERENTELKQLLKSNRDVLKKLYGERANLEDAFNKISGQVAEYEEINQKLKNQNAALSRKLILEKDKSKALAERMAVVLASAKKSYQENMKLKTENKSLIQKSDTLAKAAVTMKEFLEKKVSELKSVFAAEVLEIREKNKADLQSKKKSLLREVAGLKIERDKALMQERAKISILEEKFGRLGDASRNLWQENRKLKEINSSMMNRFEEMSAHSLANKDVLKGMVDAARGEFKDRLTALERLHLEKEIEYKARIESLTQDLKKYYEGLKDTKEKYYLRENELKEKFEEIFNRSS